ncbi:MAG TPA: transketolase [Thermomicrobiales bacterium]|nr:transketolase [Thermomicrobiales bacterium]
MAVATDRKLEALSIDTIKMLSVDAVQKANSGHPGLPMGAAAMAYVLWTEYLKHNPKNDEWFDRDRFVLSAGHGSMLLYSLLYLTGYNLPLEEIKNFRQIGSMTPGHPEARHAPGIDVTTGPLGAGFSSGVGMAIAEAYLAARYNRPGHDIIDHYTYAIVSDGDIMEGVSMEAAALAGHLGLGKLIYLYDENMITLAGSANVSMSEDVAAHFQALGWHTVSVDGLDTDEVRRGLNEARSVVDKPSLIICRTIIGFGAPNKENTFAVHGSPLGPDEVAATKEALGWPAEPAFYVPEEALTHFREAVKRGAHAEAEWQAKWDAYQAEYPDEGAELKRAIDRELQDGWDSDVPTWQAGEKVSTRKAGGAVISAFFPKVPTFIGGSADLDPSTLTAMKGAGDFEDPNFQPHEKVQGALGGPWGHDGRNIHFGIREHAMGSAVNGMAAHGGIWPFGATFLVFSDYMRPAIRLSALSEYKSTFVFTHDSIAVGEDGPTHEPIEQIMSLRLIPKMTVIRPGDANETADAWRVTLQHHGPTCLVLSRQDLPVLDTSGAKGSLANGAYILRDSDGEPDIVLIGTGSEVQLAVGAADELAKQGVKARVVSMPSWELFDEQSDEYRQSVLGGNGVRRVSVEAGTTIGWQKYADSSVGIDRFGASGPGGKVLEYFGFTVANVVEHAQKLLGKK